MGECTRSEHFQYGTPIQIQASTMSFDWHACAIYAFALIQPDTTYSTLQKLSAEPETKEVAAKRVDIDSPDGETVSNMRQTKSRLGQELHGRAFW